VINEVLYDPADGSSAGGEWVELFNAGMQAVDLGGWTLRDAVSVDTLPPHVLAAGSFLVVAASDSFSNSFPGFTGQVILLGGRIGNALGNDGDRLLIVDPGGAVADAVSWGHDMSVFDPSVDDVPAGHSIERVTPGGDTDVAADFTDNASPSPGRAHAAPAADAPRTSSGSRPSIEIIDASQQSKVAWLPWALAAGALALFGATTGIRGLHALRDRLRKP
jgi:hypothetical protein